MVRYWPTKSERSRLLKKVFFLIALLSIWAYLHWRDLEDLKQYRLMKKCRILARQKNIGEDEIPFLSHFLKKSNHHNKWVAIDLLGRIGTPNAVKTILAHSQDENTLVRQAVLDSITCIQPNSAIAISLLENALESADENLKMVAISNIKHNIPEKRTKIRLFLKIIQKEEKVSLCRMALDGLSESVMHSQKITNEIISCSKRLKDKHFNGEATSVILRLGEKEPNKVVPTLIKEFKKGDVETKLFIANVFRFLPRHSKPAVEVLVKASKSNHKELKRLCIKALERIKKENQGK